MGIVDLEFFGSHLVAESTTTFFVSQAEHQIGLVSPVHSHAYATIHFVVSGVYQETIDNKTFEIAPGEILFKPAGMEHFNDFRLNGARTCRIQIFDSSRLGVRLPARPVKLVHPSFSSLFGQLQIELADSDKLTLIAIESLSWQIICQLIRCTDRINKGSQHPKIKKATEWLKADFRSPPSVNEMARRLEIHRSQFSRLFKSENGMSAAEFVRHLRVKRAIELLKVSEESLSWIALECGFVDQSHFTKSFRKITNTTPAVWRQCIRATG